MTRCIGEPISWLALERYGLGELDGSERENVAQHLAACPACQACWTSIEADAGRALQPLAANARARRARGRRATWVWASALAAAAAVALVVWRAEGPGLEPLAARKRIKGGELALDIVRLGADGNLREPTHYAPGDRFKVLLTCPPPWRGVAEVLVYQEGRSDFPLELQTIEACGNRSAFPGAFQIDGAGDVLVCIVLSERALERESFAEGLEDLPEHSVCERLQRAPD